MKPLLLLPLSLLCISCGGGVAPGGDDGDNLQTERERKVIALLEKFDRFDMNGNGQLTRSEIIDGIKFEGVTGVNTAEIDELFTNYDANRNGSISLPEANGALAAVRR